VFDGLVLAQESIDRIGVGQKICGQIAQIKQAANLLHTLR
jgi:hypothetical protein